MERICRVLNIQEDDYGCEERPDDWEPQVIVTLMDEEGEKRWIRTPDDALRWNGIDTGSRVRLSPDEKTLIPADRP